MWTDKVPNFFDAWNTEWEWNISIQTLTVGTFKKKIIELTTTAYRKFNSDPKTL